MGLRELHDGLAEWAASALPADVRAGWPVRWGLPPDEGDGAAALWVDVRSAVPSPDGRPVMRPEGGGRDVPRGLAAPATRVAVRYALIADGPDARAALDIIDALLTAALFVSPDQLKKAPADRAPRFVIDAQSLDDAYWLARQLRPRPALAVVGHATLQGERLPVERVKRAEFRGDPHTRHRLAAIEHIGGTVP